MFTISLRLSHLRRLQPLQQALGYSKVSKRDRRIRIEERISETNKKHVNELRAFIMLAHQRQKCLSVDDWKSLLAKLQENRTQEGIYSIYKVSDGSVSSFNGNVLKILLTLRPPQDSMQTARNFIEASDMEYGLLVKRYLIQFYVKKASETTLSCEEQGKLLELYVQ